MIKRISLTITNHLKNFRVSAIMNVLGELRRENLILVLKDRNGRGGHLSCILKLNFRGTLSE